MWPTHDDAGWIEAAMAIKLWGRYTSGRTLKVLWALGELELDFELVLASGAMGPDGAVSKGHTPYGVVDQADYLAMNPNGRVPTIDDDGFVLWESNSIVRYLGMQYGPEHFYGNSVQMFASASRWLDFENNNLVPSMHEIDVQIRRTPEPDRDPAKVERATKTLIAEFNKVEHQLGETRFMCGDHWTMGDIGIGLRVHRWHMFALPGAPEWPNIGRYYAEILARPAFDAVSDRRYHAG
ncbi:MAG: glutathione S-transferase family protein [Pseudomonadota bacterium]